MSFSDQLRDRARDIGFDLVGFAPAARPPCAPALRQWVASGFAGDMNGMARSVNTRADPASLLPGARSVVVVGLSYFVERPPADIWDDPLRGRIAAYAWGPDYHEVLRPMLAELAGYLRREKGGPARTRLFVDTGPLLERHFAAAAGLGFIGRHAQFIARGFGSCVFLGAILTDIELEYDPPSEESCVPAESPSTRSSSCGRCTRCLAACPTRAFAAPYVLDARRCIAHLTIESRGVIPVELRPLMGHWIFGCDDCQAVCPWARRFSRPAAHPFLRFEADRWAPRLHELLDFEERDFLDRYAGTPVERVGRAGLLRNAIVALGNSGCPEARPSLEKAGRSADPAHRDHARWALDRLHTQL